MDITNENYLKSSQFKEAMENFQFGEWQKGLVQLNELMERYPFDLELRALNQEMQLRARIDNDEVKENQQEVVNKLTFYGIRVGLILVGVIIVLVGFQLYAGWVQEQWQLVRSKMEEEAFVLELSAKFRNGQSLYQAGFYEDAEDAFDEIKANDPNYPQVDFYIQESTKMAELDAEYNKGQAFAKEGNYEEAYQVFTSIAERQSNFRDVLIRIADLERNFLIVDALSEANTAFQEQRWDDAIAGYEYIRTLDPGYYAQDVEEFLYRGYVFAAEAVLSSENQTLEGLQVAEEYFSRALTLRPQNPEIRARRALAREAYETRLANSYLQNAETALTSQPDSINALKIAEAYFNQALSVRPEDEEIIFQRDLARLYLNGVDNYNLGFWDNVIEAMGVVYAANPDYAQGTARQTLYEAFVARGRSNLTTGDFDEGLEDMKQAALIAQESPDSVLRLYESQLLVAEAEGLVGNFRESVLVYQAAIGLSNIGAIALQEKATLADAIAFADSLASQGQYKQAYVVYRDALETSGEVYQSITHQVKEGDYLTQLARQYNSTVQAILAANGLTNRNKIALGTELIIPTLP
jgi:tetratricopeptide (TPR) repeat protein